MPRSGRWDDALRSLAVALDSQHPEGEVEAALEAASSRCVVRPARARERVLAKVDRSRLPTSWAQHWRVLDLWLVSKPDLAAVLADLPSEPPQSLEVAAAFRWHVSVARANSSSETWFGSMPASFGSMRSSQPRSRRCSGGSQNCSIALGAGNEQLGQLLAGWPAGRDTSSASLHRTSWRGLVSCQMWHWRRSCELRLDRHNVGLTPHETRWQESRGSDYSALPRSSMRSANAPISRLATRSRATAEADGCDLGTSPYQATSAARVAE